MGLSTVPYVGGVEKRRKPKLIFCECDALSSLRHTSLGSLFMDPEDVICLKSKGNLELK